MATQPTLPSSIQSLDLLWEDGPKEGAHTSPENRFGIIWVRNSRVLFSVRMERTLFHWKCYGNHVSKFKFFGSRIQKSNKKKSETDFNDISDLIQYIEIISSNKLLSLHSFCTKSFCTQQPPNAQRILLDRAELGKGARLLVPWGSLTSRIVGSSLHHRSDRAFVLELMQRIIAFLYI